MLSMTGYGKGVGVFDGRELTIELKSVNHRFLDVTVKLPRTLLYAEDTVRYSHSFVGKPKSRSR